MSLYKQNHSDWFGVLPPQWKLTKLKYGLAVLTDFTANGSFASLAENVEYRSEGYARLIRMTDLRAELDNEGVWIDEKAYNYLSKSALFGGELLMASVGSVGLVYQMPAVTYKASLAPNMYLIKTNDLLNSEYLYWSLISRGGQEQINQVATVTAQPKLNKDNVKSLWIAMPPLDLQADISHFLSRKTAKIDYLIDGEFKLINLLLEKRKSIYLHFLTKGLSESVDFLDTGVDWIGPIPSHWKLKKIKNIFEVKKRIVGTLGFDVLSITQQGIKVKNLESNDGQNSMDYSKYQLVKIGDFAMNHMDLLTGFVDIAKTEGVTSPDYRVFSIRNSEEHFDKYFLMLLQTSYTSKLFYPFGQGSSQLGRWRLPTDAFNDFAYPCPPMDEQILIYEHLSRELRQLDELVLKARNSIELLKEQRLSLITAAVTGKINVRNLP